MNLLLGETGGMLYGVPPTLIPASRAGQRHTGSHTHKRAVVRSQRDKKVSVRCCTYLVMQSKETGC